MVVFGVVWFGLEILREMLDGALALIDRQGGRKLSMKSLEVGK